LKEDHAASQTNDPQIDPIHVVELNPYGSAAALALEHFKMRLPAGIAGARHLYEVAAQSST